MSILSDRQIKALCTKPTHTTLVDNWDTREVFSENGYWVDPATGSTFRRDADLRAQPLVGEPSRPTMIEPFVPNQVKTLIRLCEDFRVSLMRYVDNPPRHHDQSTVPVASVERAKRILVDPTWLWRDKEKSLMAHDDLPFPSRTQDGAYKAGFVENEERVISYGLTSYGYDVRLGRKFKIFTNINSTVIDPMKMSDDCYVDFEGDVCIIPPHSYVLGHTIEYFRMPKDVVAVCLGKSTYARAGAAINVTPIEPGFEGQVVIEIANQTPLPMKVYANMGIAQFMFHRGEPCMVSYADRGGKYQGQQGVTTARV